MPDLIPPDLERCQAFKPNPAYRPFGLGAPPVPPRIRCKEKPTVIATEVAPGPDGLRGSMSLCEPCKEACMEQMPGHATFEAIQP